MPTLLGLCKEIDRYVLSSATHDHTNPSKEPTDDFDAPSKPYTNYVSEAYRAAAEYRKNNHRDYIKDHGEQSTPKT